MTSIIKFYRHRFAAPNGEVDFSKVIYTPNSDGSYDMTSFEFWYCDEPNGYGNPCFAHERVSYGYAEERAKVNNTDGYLTYMRGVFEVVRADIPQDILDLFDRCHDSDSFCAVANSIN